MLHQTFLFLGQLWQLFEVFQILEFLRYMRFTRGKNLLANLYRVGKRFLKIPMIFVLV